MSLRLAADNGELTISVGGDNSIASYARAFADLVESGDINASSALVVLDVGGFIEFLSLGPSPSIVEGLGMLELAKAKIVNGAFQQ